MHVKNIALTRGGMKVKYKKCSLLMQINFFGGTHKLNISMFYIELNLLRINLLTKFCSSQNT